jgi:cbb3-type cytochrome oxidase cytochrome c subunit
VDGRLGSPSPDLSRVGETRTDPEWYRKYLQEPRSVFPQSIAPPLRAPKEELDDLIAYLLSLRKFR